MEENQVEETNISDVSKCPNHDPNEEVLENDKQASNEKPETIEKFVTPELCGFFVEKYQDNKGNVEDNISSEENNETCDDDRMDFNSASCESVSPNEPNSKNFDSGADVTGEFRCHICNLKKKSHRHLQRHILLHDPNITMYSCDLCDYKTDNMKYLNRHDYKHKESEVIIYKCQWCSFETQHKRSLKAHQVVHKGPSALEVYKCGLCSYKTKDSKSLKEHMRGHNRNFKKRT